MQLTRTVIICETSDRGNTLRPPQELCGAGLSGHFFAIVCLSAWLFRLAAALAMNSFHNFTRMDMERTALSLVNTGVLGNPFGGSTGPSAVVPPGYVLFLAAVFHTFGTGLAAEIVKVITCTLASSVRCALAPWLAYRLHLSNAIVIITALISVFWIGAFDSEMQGEWDTPYTASLIMVLAYLHYARPLLSNSLRWAAIIGFLWGMGALVNPAILSILAGFLVVEVLRAGRPSFGAMTTRGLCLAGCLLFVLFPWALRNRLVLGSWVWLRSGLGLEMQLSYHPGASWANAWNIRPSLAHPDQPNRDREVSQHPYLNPAENLRMQRLGEVPYMQQKLQQALAWIRRNPGNAARLASEHAFYFWFPPGQAFYNSRSGKAIRIYTAARSLLTVFALLGCFLLWRRNQPLAVHLGSMLVFFPLVYYIVNWSSRYRMPIEWLPFQWPGYGSASSGGPPGQTVLDGKRAWRHQSQLLNGYLVHRLVAVKVAQDHGGAVVA